MTPLTLTIENFRSIRGKLVFHFPRQPGLYLMRGVNEVEPRLGGNGAGKTTIWEALHWLFWNATSRGLRAGDVANWKTGKNVRVALQYLDSDGKHELVRTWGPISWKLDGADISKQDDSAQHLLGVEPASYRQSLLFSQTHSAFLDMKPEAKATLFGEVLKLDEWLERAQRASKAASDTDAALRACERRSAAFSAVLAALSAKDVAAQAREWEVAHGKELEKLAEFAEEDEKRATTRREQAREAERALKRAEDAFDVLHGAEKELKAEMRHAEDKLNAAKTRYAVALAAQASDATHVLEAGEPCPVCARTVAAELAATLADAREQHEQHHTREVENAQRDVESIRTALVQLGRNLDALTRRCDDAERAARRAAGDQRAAEMDAVRASSTARASAEALQRCQTERNPYTNDMRKHAADVMKARDDYEESMREQRALEERVLMLSAWVRGFKELRLEQISDATTELEVEVNSALGKLGLSQWEIEFGVDADGKRGFSVFVKSPHNDRAVPWEAWSGGESQRLRLAGMMGLADLVRARCGVPLALEVWDEPTTWLTEQGVTDLLEALRTRAQVEQRQVWIVDHRTLGFHFDGGAVMTKTREGTRVEVDYG